MKDPKRPGRWKPGESGNPAGRRPGTGEVARLRAGIAEHVPAIVAKLVEAAKAGDVQAARLLLERVIAPLRAIEEAATVPMPAGTLAEQGRALLAAAAAGDLPPGQAAALLGALGTLARVVEVDELTRRVEALEARK